MQMDVERMVAGSTWSGWSMLVAIVCVTAVARPARAGMPGGGGRIASVDVTAGPSIPEGIAGLRAGVYPLERLRLQAGVGLGLVWTGKASLLAEGRLMRAGSFELWAGGGVASGKVSLAIASPDAVGYGPDPGPSKGELAALNNWALVSLDASHNADSGFRVGAKTGLRYLLDPELANCGGQTCTLHSVESVDTTLYSRASPYFGGYVGWAF